MFEVTIDTPKDGRYHTKVDFLPRVGDSINLKSYTNMASHHEWNLNYKVLRIEHELVEINEGNEIIKDYHQTVVIYCA
jgi:hypothetical protein